MNQSKLESKIEATVNIGTGFIISWVVWIVLVGPLINAGYLTVGNAGDAFIITSIFTVSSWLRSYYWRRFFANNFHTIVHEWVVKHYDERIL